MADPGAELEAKEGKLEFVGGAESYIERLGEDDEPACGIGMLNDDGGKILRGRFKCFTGLENDGVLRGWSLSSSSSQPGDPSSTSSSFASLMTTTSVPSARLPCSISIDSLSPIQSI